MARGPIAERLVRAARKLKAAKVVDLAAFRSGGEMAQDLHATMMTREQADELHPVHAFWSLVQHNLSMFGEQVMGLPDAEKIAKLIIAAEDEYTPMGPPMSPLTATYFFGWAWCDLTVGMAKESAASVTLEVVASLGVDGNILSTMRTFAASRMGLWTVIGHGKGTTILREGVVGDTRQCVAQDHTRASSASTPSSFAHRSTQARSSAAPWTATMPAASRSCGSEPVRFAHSSLASSTSSGVAIQISCPSTTARRRRPNSSRLNARPFWRMMSTFQPVSRSTTLNIDCRTAASIAKSASAYQRASGSARHSRTNDGRVATTTMSMSCVERTSPHTELATDPATIHGISAASSASPCCQA